MDDRDRLAFYPFVVVKIACRSARAMGSPIGARLAAKFGPEMACATCSIGFPST
jgi:hypothetical protein